MAEETAEAAAVAVPHEEYEGVELHTIEANSKGDDDDLHPETGELNVYTADAIYPKFATLAAAAAYYGKGTDPESLTTGQASLLGMVNAKARADGYSEALTKSRAMRPGKISERTKSAFKSVVAAKADELDPAVLAALKELEASL
jgi:hypothetical protein